MLFDHANNSAGINKFDSLSKFFDSVIDGTADLTVINEEAKAEEFVPSPEELEIEQKQEAQRMALAHGGFVDLVDFEQALKDGAGANYHDVNGFPGMMGSPPPKKKTTTEEAKEEPVHVVDTPVEDGTDDAEDGEVGSEQVVFEVPKEVPTSVPAGECTAGSAGTPSDSTSECMHPKDEL